MDASGLAGASPLRGRGRSGQAADDEQQADNRQRDALREHLQLYGVGTEIYYPKPLHLQAVFADLGYKAGDFPNAEEIGDRTISLPLSAKITDDDVQDVISAVRKVATYYAR